MQTILCPSTFFTPAVPLVLNAVPFLNLVHTWFSIYLCSESLPNISLMELLLPPQLFIRISTMELIYLQFCCITYVLSPHGDGLSTSYFPDLHSGQCREKLNAFPKMNWIKLFDSATSRGENTPESFQPTIPPNSGNTFFSISDWQQGFTANYYSQEGP